MLKILKSSETSNSAFFSFVGGGVQHISFENIVKQSAFFSFVGGPRTCHAYYNVSSYVLSNGDVNTSNFYQGMGPNHCLRDLYTKDGGWGPTYICFYT